MAISLCVLCPFQWPSSSIQRDNNVVHIYIYSESQGTFKLSRQVIRNRSNNVCMSPANDGDKYNYQLSSTVIKEAAYFVNRVQ